MCIFSGKVNRVEGTNIFARHTGKNKQALIYQMEVSTSKSVAMILPLPVKTPASEESIVFHSFSKYKDVFARLDRVVTKQMLMKSAGKKAASATLAVHNVGSFVASFVPSMSDFARLDERFRLPKNVWKSLPQYKDYGFAVFQLKAGTPEIHPMAFEFSTRDASRLFFPTVHVHDGKSFAKTAHFNHRLYFQGAKKAYKATKRARVQRFAMEQVPMLQGKTKSSAAPRSVTDGLRKFSELGAHYYINEKKACGLINELLPAHRVILRGRKANVDQWVSFEAQKKAAPKKPKKAAAVKKSATKKPASKKAAAKLPSKKKKTKPSR